MCTAKYQISDFPVKHLHRFGDAVSDTCDDHGLARLVVDVFAGWVLHHVGRSVHYTHT